MIKKPWGYEIITADTEFYRGKILVIKKGHSIHLQRHKDKDETMYILSGTGYIAKEEGSYGKFTSINPGEIIRVKAGEVHKVWANSDELKIIETSTPTPDSDVEHLEKE